MRIGFWAGSCAAATALAQQPRFHLLIRGGRILDGTSSPWYSADIGIGPRRIRDRATYQDPHQLAEGVVHLAVNGELAIRDGAFTGKLAGKVLRPEPRASAGPSSGH